MEIEQRDKLAELIFDIKDTIKDGQYKALMETLGKKEVEPDLENMRMVKLQYIDCTHIDAYDYLTECETEMCIRSDEHSDEMGEFKQERIHRVVKTQIVEIHRESDDDWCRLSEALEDSRLHLNQLAIFRKNMPHVSRPGSCFIYINDKRWIHPLKYTVLDKKEN